MLTLESLDDPSTVAELKDEYVASLDSPMDDMWESAIIGPAPHWLIEVEGRRAGFVVADAERLLSFFLSRGFEHHAGMAFDHAREVTGATAADVATSDPLFLSVCLDAQTGVAVHTFLYELPAKSQVIEPRADLAFPSVDVDELARVLMLQRMCLEGRAPDLAWLPGYTQRLLDRRELFVLENGGEWLGLGECRASDTQPGVAHVGMMVAPDHRGRGLATEILLRLRVEAARIGLRPVCSTTVENAAARRAIERAGFVSRHRILHVEF